ncbi:transposase [Streptomyces sp. SP18BB07]|uniref:transposase n=1 Tax=Streptomyces sp. SP18BB07 TaxID=3002522 RepID=UPI002E7A6A9E|nr:transposase [Streptomyces sp. SP18BB07]MEE1757953.1 transposase [Streptomyces sp. SP18BB07]
MSLRPRSGEQVPSLTARIARASNPGGTTAMWGRDRLDGLWCDEDFADWYPRDGRPGLSPAQLATVCVLQFVLGLSDRQAAEAVRCRIDFRYALAMELDDPGFHRSVLADFRDRLIEEGRADHLLDLALARLKEAGLVRERTTQRTGSTHVLAAVRDLTRMELVTEAVRAALEEVAGISPHLLDDLVDEDWGRRYGRPVRLGKNPTKRPGSSPPETTPSGSWSTSTVTEQTARWARVSRPCARSWCRTTTVTPQDTCAGALPRRKAGPDCRPRPGRSSLPTTPRPATHGTDTSSAGRGSPLT